MQFDPFALGIVLAGAAACWLGDSWLRHAHCRWCGDRQPALHAMAGHGHCPACDDLQARAVRMGGTASARLARLRDRLVAQGLCGARLRDELHIRLVVLGGIGPLRLYLAEAKAWERYARN